SGRLVGAVDLGEFAWAFENMLNRVLDNTIKASPELLELMDQGKQALPELFELFKTAKKPGEKTLVLMEHADALSQGKSIDLGGTVNIATEDETKTEPDETITSIEVEEIVETEEPVEERLPVDIDPVLLEIYRKEVETHVETLKQYIKSWNEGKKAPEQSLLRALHTLTGSSRTTGVETLAAVCSSFEYYVKHLQDVEARFPQAALAELDETILVVERTMDCLDIKGATLPDIETLLSRIEALPRDIAPLEKEIPPPPPPPPAEVASVKIEASTENAPLADYDEELLEIFLEEGTEILDESDQVIHDWVANPADHKFVEELQRQLHTLKGGARMAGIAELGDLGHSIESLLTAVVDGHMKPSKPMFDLVQRAQDRLVIMLELVQDHKGLTAATELINEVDRMLENRGEVAELDISDEVYPTDEPVVEEILDIVNVSDDLNNDKEPVSSLTSIEIPELEKLEEELRMEVEGSISTSYNELPKLDYSDVEIPGLNDVVDINIDNENIISLDVKEELQEEEQQQEEQEQQQVQNDVAEISEQNLAAEEEGDRRKAGRVQAEQVRVRADLLDNLVNFAGEVSIYRSRLEQQTNNFRYNITEFDDTVNRLREQLRQFEIETETQIEYRNEESLSTAQEDFDPLEMDRFTTMQHLSRAMMESLGDLDSLRGILNNLTRESETLLLQQSRVNTDLQEGLMRTRMVPFSGQAARLRRIVRQTCSELGKHAELHLNGMDSELDRTVLERIVSPIEHMLRNAVAHGIE
ncbi:MAG: Hpt domain-containing protein, partial [Gammaproteobacteria bacterium]|nr:Hpt domain-containing protein [Gammaproteobacteria bacterium]